MTCYWWLKKGLGAEFVKQHIDMLKQIINIWKIMIKNIESSYIEYLDANNMYGWAMSQTLPVKGLKWAKQKKYLNLTKIS